MEQRLVTLNKQYLCDEILSAEDLNTLVLFINNIINYINGLDSVIGSPGRDGQDGQDGLPGRDGNDGQDGHSPQINIGEDGYWYIDGHNTGVRATSSSGFDYNLNEDLAFQAALADILELKQKIQNMGTGLGSQSSYDINDVVDLVIEALKTLNWNNIINVSEWNPDIQAYLTEIGLITSDDFDGNKLKIELKLSKIVQRLNSIENTLESNTIFVDGQGRTLSLSEVKSAVTLWITNNLALSKMQDMIIDWDLEDEEGHIKTIKSAYSETKNMVERTDAGLQALYQQYAGVISHNYYTNSLIEGLVNEQMAKTTMSSAFGEYVFDENNNNEIVYDTYDNAPSGYKSGYYPQYETEEKEDDGIHAIPYTGLVMKYIRYEKYDEETHLWIKVNDPVLEGATRLIYIDDESRASSVTEREPDLDANGNVKKTSTGDVIYKATEVRGDNGEVLKLKDAFKVYYTSINTNSYTYYPNGHYGDFAGRNYFIFEKNITADITDDLNNIIYSVYLDYYDNKLTSSLYMNNNGEITWDYDYNTLTDGTNYINDVKFIYNYGPDVIAYHKVRKLRIKNTSGIITEANLNGAMANVFASGEGATANFIASISLNETLVLAVANAASSLTDFGKATAITVANSSIYIPRYEYDSSGNDSGVWTDIETEEEKWYRTGSTSNIVGANDSTKRIKYVNNEIVWILDSEYFIGNINYGTYEKMINDNADMTINYTRQLLYTTPNGETVYTSNGGINYPKRKVLKSATAGLISSITSDSASSQLYTKLGERFASVTTAVSKKIKNGNPVQCTQTINGTTYYLYVNSSTDNLTNIDTSEGLNQTIARGQYFWYASSYGPSGSDPIYEMESIVTLSGDLINLLGDTFILRLRADSAFISQLTVNHIFAKKTTSNANNAWNCLEITPNDGFRIYYTEDSNSTGYNSSLSDIITNHIRMDGSGEFAKGNFYWDANGNVRASDFGIVIPSSENGFNNEPSNYKGILYHGDPIRVSGSIFKENCIELNADDGISIYNRTTNSSSTKNYMHLITTNGKLNLCGGKMTWNWNNDNDNILKIIGQIDATTFGVVKSTENNNIQYSIKFTTVQNEWITPGNSEYKSGVKEAGFNEGDPIGIVYGFKPNPNNSNQQIWTEVSFFDFAPVNKGNFSANEEAVYTITRGAGSGVNVLYHSSIFRVITDSNNTDNEGKYYRFPRSNGPLIEISITDNCYLRIGLYGSAVLFTSSNLYTLIGVTVYKQIVTNGRGVKLYYSDNLGNYNYYIVSGTNITGNNLLTYCPTSLTYTNFIVGDYMCKNNVNPLYNNVSNSPLSRDSLQFGIISAPSGLPVVINNDFDNL